MYVWRIYEAHSCSHCCRGRAISITNSERVSVALVIQHAMLMRHIIMPSVACLAQMCSSTLSHKLHDIWEKKFIEHKGVFWFYIEFLSKIFLILSRIQPYIVINLKTFSCKVPVILARFYRNLNFIDTFRKKFSDIKFHDNTSSGSRGTDTTEGNSRFSQSWESA